MSATPHVYKAILDVALAMSKEGLRKDKVADTGASGKYRFRGVDDVMNALSPHLARAGLCIIPRVLERTVSERTNQRGTVMTYAVLTVEFDFCSSEDGSVHVARTMGEAMDTGDKATNKAMSAAYKYACFQAFCIPTEGDNDSENHTHERSSGDQQRDLTGPLAASTKDWDRWETTAMSGLRNAAKSGAGALKEEWAVIYDQMQKGNPPAAVRKRVTDAKDELKSTTNGGAHP